jgi:hypothetical protein
VLLEGELLLLLFPSFNSLSPAQHALGDLQVSSEAVWLLVKPPERLARSLPVLRQLNEDAGSSLSNSVEEGAGRPERAGTSTGDARRKVTRLGGLARTQPEAC